MKSDYEVGLGAMKYFHTFSQSMYPNVYKISFDDLISYINKKNKSFIAGFGFGIVVTETRDDQLEDAMENVAEISKGGIPSTFSVFREALSNRLQELDYSAFKTISTNTAVELATLSSDVGKDVVTGVKGLGTVFKNSKYIVPVLLVVGVAAYFGFNGMIKGIKR